MDTSLNYKIKGVHSGRCLYLTTNDKGHSVCEDSSDQQFKFEKYGDGYRIKRRDSNHCYFSSPNWSFGVSTCDNSADQKWALNDVGGGAYHLKNLNSQLCIHSNSDGRVGHYTCGYDDNKFYIVPTEYNCCLANVERKDAVATTDHGIPCDARSRDPGGTTCTNIYADYCKVGDRTITDSKCKALEGSNITLFNQLMKDKCDLDQFYETTECINWCKNNSTHCHKLNTALSCQEFDIPKSECTSQKVTDVKTDCQKYGIRSEQGLTVYKCSPAGIKTLTDQCKEYNILDSCTPTSLQDAIDNALAVAKLETEKETAEQMQKNYDTTQKTITDILNLTEEPSEPIPTATETATATTLPVQNIFDNIQQSIKDFDIQQWIKNNSIMFMIIIVIMLLIICSSSSVSALLVLK